MIPRYLVNFDSDSSAKQTSDVLVIGSGIAGLETALELSKEFEVSLITKGELKDTATWYAQGGVATAVSEEDSPNLHFKDTIEAGAGLCDENAVRVLVTEASDAVGDLIRLGAEFDRQGNRVMLAREGGHSLARVIHSRDTTGSEIESTLIRVAKAWKSVQIFEHRFVVDLLTRLDHDHERCIGALVLDPKTGELTAHFALATILATGGAGQLYSSTTNPEILTGDGIAMAYRAGAELADLEFVQFHPTAFDREENPRFLITEALRGEGAYLRDCHGRRFMVGAHPLAELAPRDVVTRHMVEVMHDCGEDRVYLDATHIPPKRLKDRFPNIWERCQRGGCNVATDLIPVRPAAHYTIGGVKTDTLGRTSVEGLLAIGEVACTGVHGANRLASNSLLEGLVFGRLAAGFLRKELPAQIEEKKDDLAASKISYRPEREHRSGHPDDKPFIQALMTKDVGVIRSADSLQNALALLETKSDLIEAEETDITGMEVQNMLTLAKLIAESALERTETRGVHFRTDFPEQDDLHWKRHIVKRLTQEAVLR